jgi:hypothetical protein
MSVKSELQAILVAVEAAIGDLRKRAGSGSGADLDQVADDLNRAERKRTLLQAQIAELDATELAAAAGRAAKTAERERADQVKALTARRVALNECWEIWGKRMTELDRALPGLWEGYRDMGRAALALAHDAAAAGVELPPPDTSPAADVMRRIVAGSSGLKDRRG